MAQRPPSHLDLSRAAEVLGALGVAPDGLAEIGEGSWSRAFRFATPEGPRVVRLGTMVEDFAKDARAATLYGGALAVPTIHAVGWHRDVGYAIADEVTGTPLEALDEAGWREVLPALWRAVDVIAAAPRPEDGGYGFWGTDGHGMHRRWRDFLVDAGSQEREARLGPHRDVLERHGVAPLVDAATARLRVLAEAGEGRRHVVHGDLVNRNVLASRDRITGILDWGCAIDGDPALNAAELEVWGPWYPDGLGRIDVRASWHAHLSTTGGDATDLDARVDAAALHIAVAGVCFAAATGHEDVDRIVGRVEALLG